MTIFDYSMSFVVLEKGSILICLFLLFIPAIAAFSILINIHPATTAFASFSASTAKIYNTTVSSRIIQLMSEFTHMIINTGNCYFETYSTEDMLKYIFPFEECRVFSVTLTERKGRVTIK